MSSDGQKSRLFAGGQRQLTNRWSGVADPVEITWNGDRRPPGQLERYHPSVVLFQQYVTKCNVENFGYGDFLGFLP